MKRFVVTFFVLLLAMMPASALAETPNLEEARALAIREEEVGLTQNQLSQLTILLDQLNNENAPSCQGDWEGVSFSLQLNESRIIGDRLLTCLKEDYVLNEAYPVRHSSVDAQLIKNLAEAISGETALSAVPAERPVQLAVSQDVGPGLPKPTVQLSDEEILQIIDVLREMGIIPAGTVPTGESNATPAAVETGEQLPLLSGFPTSVIPYRVADAGVTHEQVSSIPGTSFILGDPGVISADRLEDCEGNASCVVINPNTQSLLESDTSTLLCPEGGYILGFAATVTMSTADWEVTLPRQEERSWGFGFRCSNGAPGDNNLPIKFSRYDPGAILVTRFPVEVDAGAFLSSTYVQQNVNTAHASQNCGGGSDGCDTISLFVMDSNDGAWSTLDHTVSGGWKLVATNVQ